MIVRHAPRVHPLLEVLEGPTPEVVALPEGGNFPARRTRERRTAAIPAALPAQVGCLGREPAQLVGPWRAA